MKMVPAFPPRLTKEEAMKYLKDFDKYPVQLLGIRGYYKDTMGEVGKNDRGIYDDAIFAISDQIYQGYNANTDPSVKRQGIAGLKPGTYIYKIGMLNMKNPYKAFRQHGNVTVVRDGKGEDTDSPANRFYIDIHKGGFGTTSSLGCQTIYPTQWLEALKVTENEMTRVICEFIQYTLIEI